MKMKKLLSFMLTISMVLSMVAALGITASAGALMPQNDCFLDLESTTADIKDSKSIDQNYSLTVSTGSYTDVTKVKVDWTLQDITAVRTDNQIWDPDTLSWVTADSAVTANSATASFHLTNLSSVKVDAKVEFAAVAGFDPAVVYTGVDATSHRTTLGTVVTGTDVDTSITHDATVTVKVTPSTTDFATASATDSAKYGTYTVTIAKQSRMLKIGFSSANPTAYGIKINGKAVTCNANNVYSINSGDVVDITWDEDRPSVDVRKTLTDFENTSLVSQNSTTTSTSYTYTVPNDAYNYVLDFCPPQK